MPEILLFKYPHINDKYQSVFAETNSDLPRVLGTHSMKRYIEVRISSSTWGQI
jgi:hypothetical protein